MELDHGMATYWLVFMITVLKLLAIVFICSVSIGLEKYFMGNKYSVNVQPAPIVVVKK